MVWIIKFKVEPFVNFCTKETRKLETGELQSNKLESENLIVRRNVENEGSYLVSPFPPI